MTQTVTTVTTGATAPLGAVASYTRTLDDAIATSGWSTPIAVTDDSRVTVTPGTGGSIALQFTPDGSTWTTAASFPASTAASYDVPAGMVLVRAMAFGSGGTLRVDVPTSYVATLTNTQAATLAAAATLTTDPSSYTSRLPGIFYPENDGSGTSLAESGAKGPAIAVAGTTTGAWANAGWFTHDAGGNTLQIKNNPYVDGLITMQTDGSILIGCDYWVDTWVTTTTEVLWSIHRVDTTSGGVRLPLLAAGPGRFGLYYKAAGGVESERIGITLSSYLSQRISVLTEIRVLTSLNQVRFYLYINGKMQRSTIEVLGSPPTDETAAGLNFSGMGSVPSNKLGTGGSAGTRTANAFVFRHSGADRNIAGRLAAYIAANQALPTWLQRA